MPENLTVVAVPVSLIVKFPFELLVVVGLWNILLTNRIPFPPVDPMPIIFGIFCFVFGIVGLNI